MNTFSPVNLNPKRDPDALWVLLLSITVMLLSSGLLYLYLLFRVYRQARNSTPLVTEQTAVYLVFGKKLIQNRPDAEYQNRLSRLVDCPFRKAILMGGKTARATLSEAQAGYDFIAASLKPQQTVHMEDRSRNTLENLKNTRQLLNDSSVIIISSRYHLARCSLLAKNLNIKHQLCAAEQIYHFNIEQLIHYLQEAFYLHWFLCGKNWARLSRNQRMLNKIN